MTRKESGWVSLHGKIMNLPCGVADTKVDSFKDYANGHRDARHAAAELANEADAEISRLKDENEKLLAMATARMHSDTQDIAALAGEVARLRVDAERYRALRSGYVGVDFDWNENGFPVLCFRVPDQISASVDCDATVDSTALAARSQEGA